MKLYLEQFQIPVCVLNSELPVASRCHIVEQFNKGLYEAIVASDEKFLDDEYNADTKKEHKADLDKVTSPVMNELINQLITLLQEKSKRKKDKESGVARGIDFQFVSNVINFDFPHDIDSYIHR